MKKKIILSMVVAAFAIGTVGCGSDDDTKVKDENITKNPTPNPNKQVENPKSKEVKTVLNMDRNQQTQNITVHFEHQGKGVMTLVYVDTDNDTSTGYQEDDITKGAELRVVGFRDGSEGPQLYKVDDTNNSKWKKDINNTDFIYAPNAKADTIVFKKELIKDEYFTIVAQVADKDWTSIEKYEQRKLNDIKMFTTALDDVKGDSNLSMDIAQDSEKKQISVKLKGEGYLANTQIFFDTDRSKDTGENVESWKNFGADYMIGTDGKLTKWLTSDKKWDYNNSVTIPMMEKNNTINFSFKKELLGNLHSTMNIGLEVSDSSWNTVLHTIPKKNETTQAHSYAF